MNALTTTELPQAVVGRWIDAFNGRDADRLVACLDPDVELHPLRLCGLAGKYRGHDGVREWFAELDRRHPEQRIEVTEFRTTRDGRLLAAGALLGLDDQASFCAVHRMQDGMILTAHHYLSDADLLEHIGHIA